MLCASSRKPNGAPLTWNKVIKWLKPVAFKNNLSLKFFWIVAHSTIDYHGGILGDNNTRVLVEMNTRSCFKSYGLTRRHPHIAVNHIRFFISKHQFVIVQIKSLETYRISNIVYSNRNTFFNALIILFGI